MSEKEIGREYAIETENLLTSVLKDKIIKGVDLQTNSYFVQPSRYFSYPKLQERGKEEIEGKMKEKAKRQEKAEEKIAKILKDAKPDKLKRAKAVAIGILFIIGGIIMMVCGYWLLNIGTKWIGIVFLPGIAFLLMVFGLIIIFVGIIGPILGGI